MTKKTLIDLIKDIDDSTPIYFSTDKTQKYLQILELSPEIYKIGKEGLCLKIEDCIGIVLRPKQKI